ncbi:TetR/AcrR family transcriptional regulator [Roseomonas haemaphysalidis]|uniref:TetR/AcrR family transcriptional regulator n=1 Tax=Roseomonas haemaphysalidis TaxID=2768162 RepID=A0ABS3KSK0_9PROT|nr:TetR/AcrR family transcriptional regulator [Roseomonas haemaphysalidis]MBO1079940.1 TetR/AcrR family transcriptional regulator [Roseomonas haemaphysalidis]
MSAAIDLLSEHQSPKRRAILLAAAELFMADGYATVAMDAVARAAGVSKATLYAHFTGKEALFEAIVVDGCATMRLRAEALLAGAPRPLRQALEELGLHWLRFMLRPEVRALHRVMIAESGRFPALAHSFYAAGPLAMQQWLAAWLAAAQARGALPPTADPELAAEQFLSLLRGDLFVRAKLGLVRPDEEASLPALAARAAEAVLRLHAAPQQARADGFA